MSRMTFAALVEAVPELTGPSPGCAWSDPKKVALIGRYMGQFPEQVNGPVSANDQEAIRQRLDAFDSTTLQDLIDGKTERLPIDMPMDAGARSVASEILKERSTTNPKE